MQDFIHVPGMAAASRHRTVRNTRMEIARVRRGTAARAIWPREIMVIIRCSERSDDGAWHVSALKILQLPSSGNHSPLHAPSGCQPHARSAPQ